MIGFRSLIRAGRAWRFTNAFLISKNPETQSQGCCYYHGLSYCSKMSFAKDITSTVSKTKKTKTSSVWRPVRVVSSSCAEHLVEDVEVDSVRHNKSGGANTSNDYALGGINNRSGLEGGSILSVDKNSISMQVGPSLYRFIQGKGGSTQKKIEDDMGVKITFPSSKQEDNILIEGNSPESVKRASEEIQVIIDEAVRSTNLDYSHFVSLPLAIHPELVAKLLNFQNSMFGNSDPIIENLDTDPDGESADDEEKEKSNGRPCSVVDLKVEDKRRVEQVNITNIPLTSYLPKAEYGLDRSLFIKPKTFHLTVLMLKLWNKKLVDEASAVLQSISQKVMDVLDGRPVFVKLNGLSILRGSPEKARVLYAPVEVVGDEHRLLQACQVIIDAYAEAGLVLEKDAERALKLHATVMNSRHIKRKKSKMTFKTFDAREVLNKYGSEEWGEYLIREAHLSQRFTYDENGYYHCCASIPFPETC